MNTHKSEILEEFFTVDENSLAYKKVARKMLIAAKIGEALKEMELSKKDFASALGRTASEISKWLSGTQNFTLDTLTEIEAFLKVNLLAEEKSASKLCKPCDVRMFQTLHFTSCFGS